MRWLLLVVVALLTLLGVACGDGGSGASTDDAPTIVGRITATTLGTIRVESADGDAGSLAVTSDTRIEPEGAELRQGQTVSVWVSGPILESFPWQAQADIIRVES